VPQIRPLADIVHYKYIYIFTYLFAIECLRRSNEQGVGHFGPKFPGVPLGVDP